MIQSRLFRSNTIFAKFTDHINHRIGIVMWTLALGLIGGSQDVGARHKKLYYI